MSPGKADSTAGVTSISAEPASDAQFQPSVGSFHYHHQNYHHLEITVTVLWVLTPFLSTISVVMVCIAVTTNHWLLTQENMANPNYNGTGDNEYLPKSTISGLWTLCYTNPGEKNLVCSNIEYFPNEEYSPDPNDSTMAIPYTVTKSATFFILATFLLFLGEFYCLCGHFSHQRRLFTFISGVVFIISGLLMLIGLVMYISIFKAEIGGKLRPKSQLQPAVFTFQYGFSFILYVTGFVSTEISGTCAVFLYIYWHQKEWHRKRNDLRTKFSTSGVMLNVDSVDRMYPLCKRHPQLTQSLYISSNNKGLLIPREGEEQFAPILDQPLYYRESGDNADNENILMPCLKHTNMCNSFLEQYSPKHFIPKNYCNSVNENGNNEEIPSPPPEVYQCPWASALEGELILGKNNFPRDATTNTVSTIADIELDDTGDCSHSLPHEHKFITFDLDNGPLAAPRSSSYWDLDSSNLRYNSMFETISKTTPV